MFVVYFPIFTTLVGLQIVFVVYYPIIATLVGDADSVCGLLSNFLHSCRGCG